MAADNGKTIGKALRSVLRGLRDFAYVRPFPPLSTAMPAVQRRVGLALSGGFARGLAHLGVLKVLVDNGIPIDAISGASAGSVVGAAFASGCSLQELIEAARKVTWKSIGRWTIPRLGFATNQRLEDTLRGVLHCQTFEELKIPLAVVAADISTGEAVTFRSGPLLPALRASCCFPGLFTPVEYEGHLLVDGAIAGPVPVAAVEQFGVDTIIAVNLKTNGPSHTPTNLFQVLGQAFQIAQSLNEPTWKLQCDLVIEPDVTAFNWDDFECAEELIKVGESTARNALPALHALLKPEPVILRPVTVR